MRKTRHTLAALPWLLALPLLATHFYVAPTGSASGDGSQERPWDLATALAQPSSVKSGDTIWLRAGTYLGHFTSTLKGSVDKPIVVRQYAGERATLDGNDGTDAVTLLINGSDAWFWGFEIMNSSTTRSSGSTAPPAGHGEAVNLFGARTRLINLVLHDTNQGVLSPTDIPETEVNGCLIYYNGYDGSDRGHGHGIYIQNVGPGTKHVVDNVIFDQFGIGIHAYTEGGKLDNLDFEGNTSFNNGRLSQVTGLTTDILLGANGSPASGPNDSAKVAKNATLRSNLTYFSSSGGVAVNLGYSKGIASPTVVDNYFAGSTALALVNAFRPIAMTGNTLFGSLSGFAASEFPNNTYSSVRPTGMKVFVRPNKYEPGRANITIYNWDKAPTVDVSLQGAMNPGAHYELRNAQNFFGAPVLSGVYDGTPLHVPMTGLAPATPVGRPAPAPTGPDFQVFVLLPAAPPPAARARPDPSSATPASPVVVHRPTGVNASAPSGSMSLPDLDDPAPAPQGRWSWDATAGGRGSDNPCGLRVSSFVPSLRPDALPSTEHPSRGPMSIQYFPVTSLAGTPACRTSVFMTNSGIDPSTVTLTLLGHDRDNTSAPTASFVVGPRETLRAEDALKTLLGTDDNFGALEVETEGSARVSVFAEALAGPAAPGGVSPIQLRPISAEQLAPAGMLSGLRHEAAFRSEVSLLNPNAGGAAVSLTLIRSSGAGLGTVFVLVPPRGYVRRDLASLFPTAAALPEETLSVVVDAGTLPILAFASTVESAPRSTGSGPDLR